METISGSGMIGIYMAAFMLGAAHSLEPGHGKTVVAAYLVGSRGRSIDAIILGLVVTFTHSFSIILLGLLAKYSARFLTEQEIHVYLGFVASLIILGIGLWMLRQRWQALKDPSKAHHHTHLFGFGHSHAPAHSHGGHSHGHSHKNHGHNHTGHDHAHPHDDHHHDHQSHSVDDHHGHDHSHSHDDHHHGDGHSHPHDDHHHGNGHNHAHDDHADAQKSKHVHAQTHGHGHGHGEKPLGWMGLLLLGVSGGIVPCPAALALLLASVSVGQIGKGLGMVLVFSLGLAASLVAIGLAVVNGFKAARRFIDTERYAPKVAFASALIVTLIGAGTLVSSVAHFNALP